jgi:hypothetical protein
MLEQRDLSVATPARLPNQWARRRTGERWFVPALLCCAALTVGRDTSAVELPDDVVSPTMPHDVVIPAGTSYDEELTTAAIFAWRQFIALNWPVSESRRGVPASGRLDDGSATRVWETMRGRVEVYPGQGEPNGYSSSAEDYGFDAPADYVYSADLVGTKDGRVPPCNGTPSSSPPWHNLDEKSNHIRSGLAPAEPFPGQNVLLESKVNREAYVYVASRGWYGRESIRMPARRTGTFIRTNLRTPRQASKADDPKDVEFVSFPYDAMELKAAWRRLGPHDRQARFLSSRVRYYKASGGKPCYIDSDRTGDGNDVWGMLALHIARKTPNAPFFVWATFEQVDALVEENLGAAGRAVAVENPDGSLAEGSRAAGDAFSPNLRMIPATAIAEQSFDPDSMSPAAVPGHRLHFKQLALYGLPEVAFVAVNRRINPIARQITEVNRAMQAAIGAAAPESPLRHYRLVSVQWKPLTKQPGVPYTGPEPPSIYYASNVIIEAPPVHQAFSGQLSHGISKSSDFLRIESRYMNPPPNPGDPTFFNTYHDGKAFLAGGCMGCHGERQSYGTDWSFLLFRQRVKTPVAPDS